MLKNAGPKGRSHAIRTARARRRTMSPPELALWAVLRGRPYGLKFRRQHPIGDHLALDFFCNDARLAIEVDGEAHNCGDRPQRDEARDAFLAARGIVTMRVAAVDVLRDLDGVMTGVLHVVRGRLPLHHPAAPGGPPPRGKLGED